MLTLMLSDCFGNAVGAQAFQSKWAPVYRNSTIILAVMFGLEFALVAAWRIYFVRKNASRSKALDAAGISPEERIRLCSLEGETDATDIGESILVCLLKLAPDFSTRSQPLLCLRLLARRHGCALVYGSREVPEAF